MRVSLSLASSHIQHIQPAVGDSVLLGVVTKISEAGAVSPNVRFRLWAWSSPGKPAMPWKSGVYLWADWCSGKSCLKRAPESCAVLSKQWVIRRQPVPTGQRPPFPTTTEGNFNIPLAPRGPKVPGCWQANHPYNQPAPRLHSALFKVVCLGLSLAFVFPKGDLGEVPPLY